MRAPLRNCATTPATSPPKSLSSVAAAAMSFCAASPLSAPAFPSAEAHPKAPPLATWRYSLLHSKASPPQIRISLPPRSPFGPPCCFIPPNLHPPRPRPLPYATPRTPEGCRSRHAGAGHTSVCAPRAIPYPLQQRPILFHLQRP